MRRLKPPLFPAALFAAAALSTASFGGSASDSQSADDWYTAAMEATEAGDLAARDAALDAAIALDPGHEPSRAERGEVRIEGRWAPVEFAQYRASRDPNQDEYEQRRAESGDTASAQARLAKWCDHVGLDYEARPHWLAVIEEDPNNAAALRGLDAVWRDGMLWDAELAKKADRRSERNAKSAKSWESRFRRFEIRPYIDEEDLERITAELDAGAVAPVERRIASLASMGDAGSAERTRALLDAYFVASEAIDDVEVTASLCRIAAMPGQNEVRQDAIEALAVKPEADSMPLLLSALVAPIQSEHQVLRDARGNVVYSHKLSQEGVEQDQLHERNRVATVSTGIDMTQRAGFRRFTSDASRYKAEIQARMEGFKKQVEFEQEAAQTDAIVDAHNSMAEQGNARVMEALEAVSGRSLGDNPREWWDYWMRYTGYSIYDRPVERTYDVTYTSDLILADPSYERLPPPPPPPPPHECFVAGTPVWTRDGKQAIETLKAGDFVLARDPDRGGLVFRAVTETTVREPSPMVEIVAGEETIHATVGHPFWVVGSGWRMAKQLEEGDILSTVDGPVTVTAVSDYQSSQAFNLVVEGAANYYVGEQGVLVHDNTPRRPAVGLVARR